MTEFALPVSDNPLVDALVRVGERVEHRTRYSREDIARFAALTEDRNPVHHDGEAARRAGQPDVIASGQHTSALMSGMAASHFSRGDDGVARDMLCLNFNFAYRAPIVAGSDVVLSWTVTETEWNAKLSGVIAQLAGQALVGGAPAVIARGTVLVRRAGS
ncbi:MAG TPA: MaoC family dehydratase [Burkholderiaceae bacterium]